MTEKIGLEAVLSLGSFSHAVSQYNSAISGMSKNTASTASSISSSFVNLGSGILKVGAIAAGVGLAGIAALTGGLILLGSTALTEFARYERAALSVQSLVARELSQGKQVEVQRQVLAGLSKKEAEELGGLAEKIKEEELSRNTLRARIQEQSEALRQLRDAHGADALDVQTATARLAEMEHQYQTSGTEIDNMKGRIIELSGKEGQLVTVMDKVRTGQMSMTEAMKQAGPRAAELLSWISKLAVQSPFTEKGIQDAFQTALAYGFTTEAAQRLTEAEVDYAAATGKGVEVTGLIALALGQMQAKGKVSGQEIIQLTNAGIGVNKILEDMGFTLDDVSNGLVDSDKFIEAVIKDMEIFEGAAADQAGTFSGLISTLSDLKNIGLREFFTGTFTAIQPYLANFVGMLTDAALETGSIRALGDALGIYVAGGIQNIIAVAGQMMELFGTFQTGGAVGLVAALGITPDAISLFEKFRGMVTQIADTIAGPLMAAFSGLSTGGVLDTINQSITFLNEHFAELQAAILGIGAVLATGVFAALVAGILSLLTPINLIIAGVALLSAAWAGNWGNIQGIVLSVIDTIVEKVGVLQAVFTQFGAMGAGVSLLSMMGISSDTIALITTSIQSVVDSLNNLATWWTTTWPTIQAAALTGWEVLQSIFVGLQTALGPSLTQLQAQFTQVFTQISTILSSFGLKWSDVWNALLTATGIVAAGIGAAILGVIGVVAGLASGIAGGISAAITMFQSLATNVAGIFVGLTGIVVGFNQTLTALLQGNFATAWEGAKVTLQGFATFFTNIWGGMLTVAKGTLNIITSTISGFVEGIVGFFQGMYDQLVGHSIVPDMVKDIVAWFKKLPQMIANGLSGLVSKITAPFKDVWDGIKEAIKIDEWGALGTSAIEGLLEGMKERAGDVLEFLKNLAADSLRGLGQFWGAQSPAKKFMPLGASTMQGVVVGAQSMVGELTNSFAGLGQSAINALMTGMTATDPRFIHDFIDDLDIGGALRARNVDRNSALGKGISDALKAGVGGFMSQLQGGVGMADVTAWVESIGQQWGQSLSTIAHYVDIGKLYGEIKAKFDEMWGKIRLDNLANAAGIASNFSGFASAFAGMLESQIETFNKTREEALKLAEANTKLTETLGTQEDKLSTLQRELAELTTAEEVDTVAIEKKTLAIEKANETLGFQERQLAILRQELAELTSQEEVDTIAVEKKQLAIDKLVEGMDSQEKQLIILQEELGELTEANELDTGAIERKQAAITELSGEMDKNRAVIAKNEEALKKHRQELERQAFVGLSNLPGATEDDLAAIEVLKEFLASGEKTLALTKEFEGGATTTMFWDRVLAQAELNRLLAEQQRREEEITRQKEAQQKLDFLTQQINLIKLISDRGLNPADILGGITLGLNAGVTDLLAATNRVVEAMVNQINTDLQMGSPSRLMIKIFKQVMAGAAIGMERGQSLLSDAVRSIPILNGSIPQPVFSQAGGVSSSSSSTYNYNFPMTVNTAATAPAVVRQYEIKRSMYAASS